MGLLGIFLLAVFCIGLPLALLMTGVGNYLDSRNEKKCVECAETILKDARKCKHCGAAQPDTLKAVPAAPAAPVMQPAGSVTSGDIQRLTEKAARLKDTPDFIALQTCLRTEQAKGERKRFWWAVMVTVFIAGSAWLGGASPGEVVMRGLLAAAIAVIAYWLLSAASRRKINEQYRIGLEGLAEPAGAKERETTP
jgi:lipopolysaccharide export LptBFGC system permease protein LptF